MRTRYTSRKNTRQTKGRLQSSLEMAALVTVGMLLATGVAYTQQADDDNGSNRDARAEQHRDHRFGSGRRLMQPERMLRAMQRRLDLDDIQVEQVNNIFASAKPEFETLRENGRAHRVAERELDVNDADYGAKLQNLAASKGELAVASTELRGRVRAQIFAVLTSEQQEEWSTMSQRDRQASRGGRRHRNSGSNEYGPNKQ